VDAGDDGEDVDAGDDGEDVDAGDDGEDVDAGDDGEDVDAGDDGEDVDAGVDDDGDVESGPGAGAVLEGGAGLAGRAGTVIEAEVATRRACISSPAPIAASSRAVGPSMRAAAARAVELAEVSSSTTERTVAGVAVVDVGLLSAPPAAVVEAAMDPRAGTVRAVMPAPSINTVCRSLSLVFGALAAAASPMVWVWSSIALSKTPSRASSVAEGEVGSGSGTLVTTAPKATTSAAMTASSSDCRSIRPALFRPALFIHPADVGSWRRPPDSCGEEEFITTLDDVTAAGPRAPSRGAVPVHSMPLGNPGANTASHRSSMKLGKL
ncbi:hypothetical protein IV498_10575, partial [Paenarthrobacter sp. Z7-10]